MWSGFGSGTGLVLAASIRRGKTTHGAPKGEAMSLFLPSGKTGNIFDLFYLGGCVPSCLSRAWYRRDSRRWHASTVLEQGHCYSDFPFSHMTVYTNFRVRDDEALHLPLGNSARLVRRVDDLRRWMHG